MSSKKADDVVLEINEEGEYVVTPSSDERMLAMLIYVTSFITVILGPLLIWLLKREESSFIDFHGKEYLNFLISYFVYNLVAWTLAIILIGFILGPIVGIAALISVIVAAVKAYQGERYRIPFIFRLIK